MTSIRLILVFLALITGAFPLLSQSAPDAPGAALVQQALARREAGDVAGAIADLEAARQAPDVPAVVLEALGALYLEANRPADALEVLQPRTTVAEPNPEVLTHAAQAALALGHTDEAEVYLTKAVARAPVSRAALILWTVRDRQERHREAAEALSPLATEPVATEIEQIDPTLAAKVALGYAQSSIANGSTAEAIPPLQRFTRLRPEDPEGWRLLGESLLEGERFEEARAALAKAQQIDERQRQAQLEEREDSPYTGLDLEGLLQLSAKRHADGDLEGALDAITEGIRLAPLDPRPRMLQVELLLTLNRPEQALPRAEAVVEVMGRHPYALFLRGMSRLATADSTGAEADLRQVLELEPDHLPALNGLASSLILRGELDEAYTLSQRALELAPGNPQATANSNTIAAKRAKADP